MLMPRSIAGKVLFKVAVKTLVIGCGATSSISPVIILCDAGEFQ